MVTWGHQPYTPGRPAGSEPPMTPTAHPATIEPTVDAPFTRGQLPMLSGAQRAGPGPALLDVVEYRKSGLSLNWIVGCPLDCGYCVRPLFGNFGMKAPRALMSAGEALAGCWGTGSAGRTPPRSSC